MAYKSKIVLILTLFLFFNPLFSYSDSRIEIYNLRYHTHPSFTRIVVDIGKLREYNSSKLPSPDRVYVDIYQAKLNPILHGKTFLINNNYISQIRIAQKSFSTVRVVADLDFKKIKRYQVWHLFDPYRIVIDIYPETQALKTPDVKVPRTPDPGKSGYSMARQLGLGIHRIVIDPGHGGNDPGCIGHKRIQEKDIVLDVALRLKKLLNSKNDLEVILTRESDIFIPLEDRTVIANQKQADIYVSIHANSHPNNKRSGVETFFLNFSVNPSVIRIAARENATSTKNISEMKEILEKIIKHSKSMESKELAEKIQKNIVKTLSMRYKKVIDLGVKGGPFWVLVGSKMPSVLIEISHLSNLNEESRLKTSGYRQLIAQGIYEGLIEYIKSLGKA